MDTHDQMIRKNRRAGFIVLGVVIGMIALSFASVPLYKLFCQATGFDGTTQVSKNLPGVILDRTITIHFNADTGRTMHWIFKPGQKEIRVRLGERGLTAFRAENQTGVATAGSAIYNVTPLKAGKYFHKIQCFCFDEQKLGPYEKADLPVLFFVDPSMDKDPNLRDVHTITLSYTFYPAQSKELEDAIEAFYNDGGPKNGKTN